MTIDQLRIFTILIETRSFTETARRMHISQPAVSSIIQSLESEFEVSLLIRHPGRNSSVIPSEAGLIFKDYCAHAIQEYDAVRNSLLDSENRPQLSLVVTPSANASFAPYLFQAFCKIYTNVTTHYESSNTVKAVELLRQKKCDVALLTNTTLPPDIEKELFLFDPLQLIAPANYPLDHVISMRKLKKLPLILRDPALNSMQLLNQALKHGGTTLNELNKILEVHSMTEVLQSVILGVGCGFVPRSLLFNPRFSSSIKTIDVEKLDVQRYMCLARLKDAPLTKGARLFWEYTTSSIWRTVLDYNSIIKL